MAPERTPKRHSPARRAALEPAARDDAGDADLTEVEEALDRYRDKLQSMMERIIPITAEVQQVRQPGRIPGNGAAEDHPVRVTDVEITVDLRREEIRCRVTLG